ncbi:hypothetical protein ABZY34_04795 [Streptomyces virginiae]|uniref:hypothetical protein n=1 Tax=Streptomyces virginiae TaxID=1961 RepID=UPI0033A3112C
MPTMSTSSPAPAPVTIDEENTYTVTDGDGVNQGVGDILQPITQVGVPSARPL